MFRVCLALLFWVGFLLGNGLGCRRPLPNETVGESTESIQEAAPERTERVLSEENRQEHPEDEEPSQEREELLDGSFEEHPTEPSPDEPSQEFSPEIRETPTERDDKTNPEQMEESIPEQPPEPPKPLSPTVIPIGKGAVGISKIRRDGKGNLYFFGIFSGQVEFGSTKFKAQTSSPDLYVAKMSPQGRFLWAVAFQGKGSKVAQDFIVDAQQQTYITGTFNETLQFGKTQHKSKASDMFVAKLDPQGQVIWSRQGGGSNVDRGKAIGLDGQGRIYLLGQFIGPAKFGKKTIRTNNFFDLFVAQLSPQGQFNWVVPLGGSSIDTPTGLAVSSKGTSYALGWFLGPTQLGTKTLISQNQDFFVCEINAQGKLGWIAATQGKGSVTPSGISLSPQQDQLFLMGEYEGAKTFGSKKLTSSQHGDIFVSHLTLRGKFDWTIHPKGGGHVHPNAFRIGPNGKLYLAGDYSGNMTFGNSKIQAQGVFQAFVAGASAQGVFSWAVTTQGTKEVIAKDLAIDGNGTLYVVGDLKGASNFPQVTYQPPQGNASFLWTFSTP